MSNATVLPTITFEQLERILPGLWLNNSRCHFYGDIGTGKSKWFEVEAPKIIAKALGIEQPWVNTFYTHCIESVDVAGFTVPVKRDDGKMVTRSTIPQFFPEDGAGEGLILFDEARQADMAVQKAMAPVILDGRAGTHQLPANVRRWQISNPDGNRAGTIKSPAHKGNRECSYFVKNDPTSLTRYALDRPFKHSTSTSLVPVKLGGPWNPLWLGFLRFKPGVVFDLDYSLLIDNQPVCTPRSYEAAHDECQAIFGDMDSLFTGNSTHDGLVTSVIAANIGMAAATELAAFLKIAEELHTFEDIVANPTGIKIPDGRRDIAYAYVGMVCSRVTPETAEAVMQFVDKVMPKEMQVVTVKTAMEKSGGALMNIPSFSKWVQENPALIHASVL